MNEEKYKNKFRIQSTRLKNWDYGSNGSYFITICTQNREWFFGEIKNGIMKLSNIGEMAQKYWHEIPQHFPFVKLGEFVVMPNHVHGIIIIDKPTVDGTTVMVETQNFASLPSSQHRKNKFGPQSKNLASIVRGYKIGVTKNVRQINPDFAWQPRFYDHIIHNQKSFDNISQYIINNPLNWKNDNYFYTKESR